MVKKLLGLSEFAILGVLLFHAAGWGFVAMFAWSHRYMAPDLAQAGLLDAPAHAAAYYGLRAIEQLVVFSIPAFLFVTGYFVAVATGRSTATVSWRIIGARIRALFIPYLLWSALLWGMMSLEGQRLSLAGYAELLLTGRTNPAYYYVPLLISFYLISPMLVVWARQHWKSLLVAAAAIQTAIQLLYYPTLTGMEIPALTSVIDVAPKWFFPVRIFWFALGIVTALHLLPLTARLQAYRMHLVAAVIILFIAGMIEWEWFVGLSAQPWLGHRETLIDTLYGLAVILCFLSFSAIRIPTPRWIGDLSGMAFGIYLIHSPVMEVTARLIYRIAPGLLGYQIVLQPVLWISGLGAPLLLMALVSRSPLRGYYRHIFG